MPRKRTIDIHELLFDSELFAALGSKGLLFYVVLWSEADDFGGVEQDFAKFSLNSGFTKINKKRTKSYIEILLTLKKIIPYEPSPPNGKKYLYLKNFLKHQKLRNASPPSIPLPPWVSCTIKAYPSGKRYAVYSEITSRLPRHSAETLKSLPVASEKSTNRRETIEKKLKETKGHSQTLPGDSKKTPETPETPPEKIPDSSLNGKDPKDKDQGHKLPPATSVPSESANRKKLYDKQQAEDLKKYKKDQKAPF